MQQLDLVEIAPQSQPPVCRIMDYNKFRYDQKRKEREARKKQHNSQLKELRIKPKIAEHDYLVKLKNLEKFLRNNDKVKVRMTFRGREITHMEFGKSVLSRLEKDVANIGELEKPLVREGRNIVLIFKPK